MTEGIAQYVRPSGGPSGNPPEQDIIRFFCGFSRKKLLPTLVTSSFLAEKPAEEVEITEFLRASAVQQVVAAAPPNSDILFLGDSAPDQWRSAPSGLRLWRLVDIQAWLAAKVPSAPFSISPAFSSAPELPVPSVFRVVFSTGIGDQIPGDPKAFARLEQLLRQVTARDGWNFHYFTAVVHPDYLWIQPLHSHLRMRFVGRGYWPTVEDTLGDEDAFFMSQETYDRCWRPSTKKSYQDFGRVCWLNICWQAG